jgi:hypothetical protein
VAAVIQLLAVRSADSVVDGPEERRTGRRDEVTRSLVEARARAMHPAGCGSVRHPLELVED